MRKWVYAATLIATPFSASAQNTTYQYDALGRLTGSRTTVNGSPVNTTITYDPAGNRRKYQVDGAASGSDTGAGASAPTTRRFVVVPLNGFTLIPIN